MSCLAKHHLAASPSATVHSQDSLSIQPARLWVSSRLPSPSSPPLPACCSSCSTNSPLIYSLFGIPFCVCYDILVRNVTKMINEIVLLHQTHIVCVAFTRLCETARANDLCAIPLLNVVSPMHYLFSVGSKSHLKSSSPSKVNPHNDEKSDCRRKERKWKKIGLHLF